MSKDTQRRRKSVHFPPEVQFHDLIKNNDVKTATEMLSGKPCDFDINEIGDDGVTVLHLAALNENLKAVKLLVKNGADPNKQDSDGWTPLHVACNITHPNMIKYLLSQGADRYAKNNKNQEPANLIGTDETHQDKKLKAQAQAAIEEVDDQRDKGPKTTAAEGTSINNHKVPKLNNITNPFRIQSTCGCFPSRIKRINGTPK